MPFLESKPPRCLLHSSLVVHHGSLHVKACEPVSEQEATVQVQTNLLVPQAVLPAIGAQAAPRGERGEVLGETQRNHRYHIANISPRGGARRPSAGVQKRCHSAS